MTSLYCTSRDPDSGLLCDLPANHPGPHISTWIHTWSDDDD